MTKKICLVLAVWTNIFLLPCMAQNITIGYSDFPPFIYQDTAGKTSGFFLSPVLIILKEAGIDTVTNVKYISEPNTQLIPDILSGKITLTLGLPGTPAFKDKIYVGTYPIVQIKINAYYIGEKQPITAIENLAGKSIIVIKGYSYGGMIEFLNDPKNKCVLKQAISHEEALKLLQTAKADYLLDYTAPINVQMETSSIAALRSTTLTSIPVHFIISKTVPDGEALMNKINEAHQALIQKGKIKLAN